MLGGIAQCRCACHWNSWLGVNPPVCTCMCNSGISGSVKLTYIYPPEWHKQPPLERDNPKIPAQANNDAFKQITNDKIYALQSDIAKLQEENKNLYEQLRISKENWAANAEAIIKINQRLESVEEALAEKSSWSLNKRISYCPRCGLEFKCS